MPVYKGFNPMGPGDVKPWGAGDYSHEQNVIDCLVMDTIGQTKNLAGHKHRSLYDGYGYQTLTSDDTTKTIKIGAVGGDHKVEVQLGYGSPSFNIKKSNGASAIKWEDGTSKATINGALDVIGNLLASGDIYTQGWTNISALCTPGGLSSITEKWIWSRKIGAQITMAFRIEGVSNATYFNLAIPYNADTLGFDVGYAALIAPIRIMNNSLHKSAPGHAYMAGTDIGFMTGFQYVPGGDWINSGNKMALGVITFTGSNI